MKLVLSTSPHVKHGAVLQNDFSPSPKAMYSFAPTGLLSLIAVLRRESPDVDVSLYDLNRQILAGRLPLDGRLYAAIAQDLCQSEPDVIGFMTECDSYHHLLSVCEHIKTLRPSCTIVLGGPHASAVAHSTLESQEAVDAIVIGEGESSFPALLKAIASGSGVGVPGTVRKENGRMLDGGPGLLVPSLDHLPVPAYDLYQPDPGEEMFLEAGRGCPFQCTFCSTAPYWKRRHRVKSAERIVMEVNLLVKRFGTKRIHFTHDLFTTHRAWVIEVCRALISAGAPVRWTCSARVDTVDEQLLSLMADAGCNAIYFGIESGSERILREIKKDIPLEESFRILSACHRVNITPNAGFIIGFPTEDTESLRATFDAYELALKLGCKPTHLFAFCPFADSSMYKSLNSLQCRGHFVDLPLGEKMDRANRKRVAGNPSLFGAYHRPALPDVVDGLENAIDSLDEFSPLVEAVLTPTLELSRLVGGMFEVFRMWLPQICAINDARGAADYRRGYGSPARYAGFVARELERRTSASPGIVEAARAIETTLLIGEQYQPVTPTTMAAYRSLPTPLAVTDFDIRLDTSFSCESIVALQACRFDVAPLINGAVDIAVLERETFLIWQAQADQTVRLIQVDRSIFGAIELLRQGASTPGEMLLKSFAEKPVDASTLISTLATAAREGLVAIRPQ